MMRKASPRTSLYLALCAALTLPACGDSTPEDTTGTGSNTESKDTASASSNTNGQTTGSDDGSGAESSTGSASSEGSATDSSTGGTDSTTGTTSDASSSTTDGTSSSDTSGDTTTNEVKVTFKKDVLPIFKDECGCHRGNSPADGLDLNDANAFASLVGTGKNGPGGVPYVKANDSAGSYLYQSVNYTATPEANRMPKAGKMADAKVKVIKDWIDGGAVQE